MNINKNFLNLENHYLFSAVARRVSEYRAKNPGADIISLGIGDVTRPLPRSAVAAMRDAAAEMGKSETFRGYGDERGYAFLRRAVAGYYEKKGVRLSEDEVFISDGAKSDLGNMPDIFGNDNIALIPDPVYPAYVDANIMAGRKIIYARGGADNGFLPMPDARTRADIIYLCSPNNPTGAVYDGPMLKKWVDYALEREAVILFDSAYEAFVRNESLPTSIYAIEGARRCAIEFCSLSKTAGFTGTRLGYTVVPEQLERGGANLNALWLRRQSVKFNGVPYIVQRGAQAVFGDAGLAEIRENIDYYMENARIISGALSDLGIWYTGGKNAPYIWLRCPKSQSSWAFFDELLKTANIVGTPGAGFGANGEGYFRLSAFASRERVLEAVVRLRNLA